MPLAFLCFFFLTSDINWSLAICVDVFEDRFWKVYGEGERGPLDFSMALVPRSSTQLIALMFDISVIALPGTCVFGDSKRNQAK